MASDQPGDYQREVDRLRAKVKAEEMTTDQAADVLWAWVQQVGMGVTRVACQGDIVGCGDGRGGSVPRRMH